MKKYFTFLYICMGMIAVSAQFKENVFDNKNTDGSQTQSSPDGTYNRSSDLNALNSHEESDSNNKAARKGPGNPAPAPIDGYIPVLLLAGAALIVFYQRKKKNINL